MISPNLTPLVRETFDNFVKFYRLEKVDPKSNDFEGTGFEKNLTFDTRVLNTD